MVSLGYDMLTQDGGLLIELRVVGDVLAQPRKLHFGGVWSPSCALLGRSIATGS